MPEFSGATAKLNLIEPTVFTDYVKEQQTATNRLLSSGILTTDPIIQAQLLKGGTYVTIPTLARLDGEAQTWNDTSDISVGNVDSYTAVAPQMYQAKAFGYTDFGQLTTGAPVAEQIAGQFAAFWNIQDNKLLIAVLKNAFLNEDLQAVKSYGFGTPAALSPSDFIAALSRMGDVASPQLTKIVVNSAVVGAMRDQNLIETIQPSTGGAPINYYNSIEIVEDDALPVADDGTTDAFIIANGAVAYGLANPANSYEVKRDSLGNGGQTAVINRRTIAMQVAGTSFTDVTKVGSLGYGTINAAENSLYSMVGDPRNIGIVDYRFKVDSKFVVAGINGPVTTTTKAPTTTTTTSHA